VGSEGSISQDFARGRPESGLTVLNALPRHTRKDRHGNPEMRMVGGRRLFHPIENYGRIDDEGKRRMLRESATSRSISLILVGCCVQRNTGV
jgi:hypothetical protein